MKNTIKANRALEAEYAQAQIKVAERAARLAAIEPVDIIGTMDEVLDNTARAVRNEEGYTMGTNGGKLYQAPVYTENGMTTIAAESPEALEGLKEAIQNGRQGDGKYHKLMYIGGIPCDCVGDTPEELEADIAAAEDYYRKHINGNVIHDIDVAEQLVDAEYKKEDLEQIKGSDGLDYMVCYDGNYVMDLEGNTLADLTDLKSQLTREDVKTLLVQRLEKYLEERQPEYDEYDDEDYDDECDDEYDDDDGDLQSDLDFMCHCWFN